jgi:hypothetical protein
MTGFIDFNDASRSYYAKLESQEKAESSDEFDYMYDLNAMFNEIAEVVIKHTKTMRNAGVYSKTRKEFAQEAISSIQEALKDTSDFRVSDEVIQHDDFLDMSTIKHMIEDL